ncbi:MAG: dockerin type I repeat-containing protein, partial [Muribaculaceae bacterium]|nr:dockerin type I repeat-containing protein [Muribaculaceae bacterium]
MKKSILSFLILTGVMAAAAAIYPYLNVGLSNGSETSYPTSNLTLTFENGKLVASSDGVQLGTNDLNSVLYMMFGLGNEGGGQTTVIGDVDGDGSVTAGDITALYDFLLNNDDSHIINGDQDGDGNITAGDVTFVYNILLGNKGRSLGEITEGDQTMWVVTGDVSWAFTTEQLGTIYYNGTTFTAQGKTFNIADVDQIYVDNTPVADNTVDVAYNGNTAKVIVAGNIAKNMTATVNGAHVVALQDADVTDEITYTLAGNTTNGSFYQDGELKISVRLNGLTI